MIGRFISCVLFIFALLMLVGAGGNASDPIFLFVSNLPLINVLRFLLALVLLVTALKGQFNNARWRLVLRIVGIGLALFSPIIMFSSVGEGPLYDFIKPLDLIVSTEAGIVFTLVSFNVPVMAGRKALFPSFGRPIFPHLRNRLS